MNLTNHRSLAVLHENCLAPRAYFIPFASKEEAARATCRDESDRYQSLCGTWAFHWYEHMAAIDCDPSAADLNTAAFEEICQQLKDDRTVDLEARKTNILKTVACKAAIKAGWKTDVRELFVLAEAVVSQKIKYCPHGRPVAVVYTREDLDKEFKRIV